MALQFYNNPILEITKKNKILRLKLLAERSSVNKKRQLGVLHDRSSTLSFDFDFSSF